MSGTRAQTKTDHETFLTRSADTDLSPSASPKPVPSRSSSASIAMPSAIASHATRNSVVPRFAAGARASSLPLYSPSAMVFSAVV